ncbi:M24 family metallopeptidase [Deltaproteobacteria bacterium]|nr:M24 family metallopeptidase [Deltaproteobacteria bacterium]
MEQIISIKNGKKQTAIFSVIEMESRLTKLRSSMEKENVDAVFFTSIHNINYYNHFVYCSFGRPYGLVVTQDKIKSITANIDGGQPWRRGFGENIIFTDWERDNYFRAAKNEMKESARIGVEYDQINLENLKKLQSVLPDAQFIDISKMTMRQRMIKSSEEIELIRNGAQVGDIGGAACVEAIAEGVPEHEIALHSTQTMVREIAKRYPESDIMDTWTWFQSGINTDGAHNPVSTRKIQKGDILSLNCFPMIGGYYTALERTLFFDYASERHLEIWEINIEVHRRGLEIVKPGVRCCDIAAELNDIFRKHDLLKYRTFGYGHSFGTLSHYYGREAGLELREDIETVLEPNMVISIEPMVMLPEGLPGAGGYREHDILLVTEDGSENITKFPFGPEHNIIN